MVTVATRLRYENRKITPPPAVRVCYENIVRGLVAVIDVWRQKPKAGAIVQEALRAFQKILKFESAHTAALT